MAKGKSKGKTKEKLNIEFTDEIPKVTKEFGGSRTSKYTPLLDKVAETGKVAVLTLDTQGQASSRASSIKNAAESHDTDFDVATRSSDDGKYRVYVAVATASDDEAA